MVSVALGRGFEPQSDQIKDYEIGMYCFIDKHAALRSNSKSWIWFDKTLSRDIYPFVG